MSLVNNNSLYHTNHFYYYTNKVNEMNSNILPENISAKHSKPEAQTYALFIVIKNSFVILIFLFRHKLDILYAVAKSELDMHLPTEISNKRRTDDELTDRQIFALEYMFSKNKHMDSFCKASTSSRLNLTASQFDKWFQKRRLLEHEKTNK